MSCPETYLNKKIEIKTNVKNHDFFSKNVVNNWTFKDYLNWTDDVFLRRIKTELRDYKSSLNSLSKKQKMDRDLSEYVSKLINAKFSDENLKLLRNELMEERKAASEGRVNIINSVVTDSNIIAAQGDALLSIGAGKRPREPTSENTVSVKKNNKSYSLIKPITSNVSLSLDSPAFDQDVRAKVDEIAYIKINNNCVCENPSVSNEYQLNLEESEANTCMNRRPAAREFLSKALDQNLDTLLVWLGKNGFDSTYTEEDRKAVLFIRLVLTDFYANCMKPPLKNLQNERTPFVEYLIPIFKYYSSVYQDINFQWCEKGMDGNICIKYYGSEDKGTRRLGDGIGYVVADGTENMLIESSGEENEDHKKEDTIKLLECSIRALKLEMEKNKSVSFSTYKRRRFFSYLYANDKLTMLMTSVVDPNHWGFVYVREARIPRTWDARLRWLKVFELMFCTRDKLEEQWDLARDMEKEEQGWVQVPQSESIGGMSDL